MTDAASPLSPSPIEALKALFAQSGAAPIEPSILQPADIFLDTAGEDIRRRLFVTLGADGAELCLRPDYTIPVCRTYLSQGASGRAEHYSYLGPVFRQRPGELGEFLQAGVERLGDADAEATDAGILAQAFDAVALFGLPRPQVKIGDEALFMAVLEALGLPTPWRRRLRGAFGDRGRIERTLARLTGRDGPSAIVGHAGFLGAIAGSNGQEARQVVEDLLAIAGIKAVGGRSAHEIAERFLEQAALGAGAGLSTEAAGLIARFLDIAGEPNAAADTLDRFAAEAGIDIAASIMAFRRRNRLMREAGIDVGALSFAADFGRNLDYYTGFVFEMRPTGAADDRPLVGGGRYDALLARLGAPAPVPAVGFSMWLDRLGVPARDLGARA